MPAVQTMGDSNDGGGIYAFGCRPAHVEGWLLAVCARRPFHRRGALDEGRFDGFAGSIDATDKGFGHWHCQ